MTRGKAPTLRPTPAEAAAMLAAAWFLWFLADGVLGIVAGLAGVGAGMLLSRVAGIIRPGRPGLGQSVWLLVIVGFVVAAPFLASGGFRVSQMATAGYLAIGVLGLNLLTGYTGQGSIGHSAFLGIGAYAVAVALDQWDVNIVLAMVAAVLLATMVGLLVGIPALRLSGPYLAIATLGLAVVFPPIVRLNELADLTGGRSGINLFSSHRFGPPVDWGWLTDERWYYFITMSMLGLGVILAYNLVNSAAGRAFRAVRDNEIAAAAMGVNVARTKLTAFAISSAYAGLAGGLLFVLANRFVSPESFQVFLAIEFLVAMVVGGMASIQGSLLGGFFLVYAFRPGGVIETVAVQTESGGGFLEVSLPGTEGASDTWVLMAGALLVALVLFKNRWIAGETARLAARTGAASARIALIAARLVAAAALAVPLAWLFRQATEDLFTLEQLRPAITGAVLIAIVLALPGGLAGFLRRIQTLTWEQLFAGVAVGPAPAATGSAGPAEPRPGS